MMRLRPRRPLAVAAATVLAGVGTAVAVASPAMAAVDYCANKPATIVITKSGNFSGTAGNDVVVFKHTGGMATYNPVGGSDYICGSRDGGPAAGGPITIFTAGNGHNISGTPQNDIIYGSEGPDDIAGGAGDDIIKGNGGNDYIIGYAGNDYLRGNDGDDILDGHLGDDCIVGGRGTDSIRMGAGNDTVLVGHENRYNDNQCAPEEWDTSQAALNFANAAYGAGHGGSVNDAGFGGGGGNDRVWGSNGVDTIDTGSGNDLVRGFNGNDNIQGGGGADSLNGGNGNDTLNGGGNDGSTDALYGGPGTDTLTGTSADLCFLGWDPPAVACPASG